jgi:long-subunit fatty acid transport protein
MMTDLYINCKGTLPTSESIKHNRFSLSGFNANVGILWNITDKITLGAVLKTPFTADLRNKSNSVNSVQSVNEDLDFPMSYGIGFAYRFSDELTVSLDISRTEWDNYVLTEFDGKRISPVTGKPTRESDIDETHQVRMGGEYLFISPKYVIPLRGGLFYDPAPAEGSPDDFYGLSIGSGIAYERFVFDIAYQYRFGNDVGAFILENFKFSQDVDEHMIYTSVIIHF